MTPSGTTRRPPLPTLRPRRPRRALLPTQPPPSTLRVFPPRRSPPPRTRSSPTSSTLPSSLRRRPLLVAAPRSASLTRAPPRSSPRARLSPATRRRRSSLPAPAARRRSRRSARPRTFLTSTRPGRRSSLSLRTPVLVSVVVVDVAATVPVVDLVVDAVAPVVVLLEVVPPVKVLVVVLAPALRPTLPALRTSPASVLKSTRSKLKRSLLQCRPIREKKCSHGKELRTEMAIGLVDKIMDRCFERRKPSCTINFSRLPCEAKLQFSKFIPSSSFLRHVFFIYTYILFVCI